MVQANPSLGMQVEMTPDEARDFATWLAERGNNLLKRAENIARQSTITGIARIVPNNGTVTLEQFQESVLKKSGRVSDLAKRLGVDEIIIDGFLSNPQAKVAIGSRGWIQPKDKINGELK